MRNTPAIQLFVSLTALLAGPVCAVESHEELLVLVTDVSAKCTAATPGCDEVSVESCLEALRRVHPERRADRLDVKQVREVRTHPDGEMMIECEGHAVAFWKPLPLRFVHHDRHGGLGGVPVHLWENDLPGVYEADTEGYEELGFETETESFRLLPTGEVRYWGPNELSGQRHCYRLAPAQESVVQESMVDFFEFLSGILEKMDFWRLEASYMTLAFHGDHNFVYAKRCGRSKVVWNYDGAGPVQLWLFGQYFLNRAQDFKGGGGEFDLLKHPRPDITSATECLGEIVP